MGQLEQAIEEWKNGDYSQCFNVIRKHAENGDPEAMLIFASSLNTEHWGLSQDVASALIWFKKAHCHYCGMILGHPSHVFAER